MPSRTPPFSWRPFEWNNLRAFFSGSVRERDRAEFEALSAAVSARYARSPFTSQDAQYDFVIDLVAEAARRADTVLPQSLKEGMWEFVLELLDGDPIIFGMPQVPSFDSLSLEASIAWHDLLTRKLEFLTNATPYTDIWREKIIRLIEGFLGELPASTFAGSGADLFSIALVDLCDHVPHVVERLMATMYDDDIVQTRLFETIRLRFEHNLAATLGMTPEQAMDSGRMPITPTQSDKVPREVVSAYLADTPFRDLFAIEVPFGFPAQSRFEHTVMVAGSGHGKTQTLEALICNDLGQDDPPGLIVIDSKGDMVRRLSQLDLFHPEHGRLKDRLIVIDPRDGPSLNLFDVKFDRLGSADPSHREQIVNGVIGQMAYFFESLLGAEISSSIGLVFHPLAQLMVRVPGANLHTLVDAIDDPSRFGDVIDTLPPGTRRFLKDDFQKITGKETKGAVKRRIYGIITQSPTFERMFNAPENRIDLADALNRGSIVLISTERNFLDAASPVFGRYFISQCISAALQRAVLPEGRRKPAYLYIDEAAAYFDHKIDELLATLRSYRLGAVLAFQYLAQASPGLLSSMSANTSIKLMGGASEKDAKAFASDMRTNDAFILAQHKDMANPPRFTRFAAYVRNHTAHAVSLSVPLGALDQLPKMDDAAYVRMREENRSRFAGGDDDSRAAASESSEGPRPADTKAAPPSAKSDLAARIRRLDRPATDEDTLTRPSEDY